MVSLVFFFLFLSCVVFLPTTDCITSPIDIEALKQIKKAIDPASIPQGSCISSWDFSVDPCDNLNGQRFTCGFRCDDQTSSSFSGHRRVTEITLETAEYSGTLSPAVGNLRHLTALQLSPNSFNGSIPASIGNLPSLRFLTLSTNSFSGAIPPELGRLALLEELYLDNNQLTGAVPPTFSGLKSLRRLELQGNNLSGHFPDLTSLQNLNFLHASDNQFTGAFPESLPASLVDISMRNNQLEGSIPMTIGNLKYLQVMDLSQNRLSGWVPATLFEHPSLQQVTLSFNQFWGLQIPPSYGSKSELIALDLKNNRLSGFLPLFLAAMPKLSALSLENNMLTGMIPPAYGVKVMAAPGEMGVQPFARLMLAGNYLFGPIPMGLLSVKPGDVAVSLADNCLFRCPNAFFFCQGVRQKPLAACRSFNPGIPEA
ncbi:leucine-rich repeat receptor protein kinase MSL1-like [Nymphaea colorata]|nr:leucine-rich repeat receptor protein kinase MSL1-like [Nymphaea colorata]